MILFLLLRYKDIIFARIKFILLSGLLGGVLFFIIDLPATRWGAWSMNYEKTIGPMFGGSVVEELIWVILVMIIIASMVEVFLAKIDKKSL